jgi:hypothetical protein
MENTIRGKKAVVRAIQVGGYHGCNSLKDMCEGYLDNCENQTSRDKICFAIELENGETRQLTVRQEDSEIIAYGDFTELPSFVEYSFLLREQGKI